MKVDLSESEIDSICTCFYGEWCISNCSSSCRCYLGKDENGDALCKIERDIEHLLTLFNKT